MNNRSGYAIEGKAIIVNSLVWIYALAPGRGRKGKRAQFFPSLSGGPPLWPIAESAVGAGFFLPIFGSSPFSRRRMFSWWRIQHRIATPMPNQISAGVPSQIA